MKALFWIVIFFILCAFYAAAETGAEPTSPVMVGSDASLCSRYIWRGLVFDQDPVLQTDMWVQAKRLTFIFWGNMDLTDSSGKLLGQFNEWDTFLSLQVGAYRSVVYGCELDYLSFPSSSGKEGSSTAEVSVWLTADLIVSPTVRIYWDIWQQHSIYVNLSVAHSSKFGRGKFAVSSGLGWGDEHHNRWSGIENAGGWLDWQAYVGYYLPLGGRFGINPAIQLSTVLQNDIRNYYQQNNIKANSVFFSLLISYTIS